MHATCSSKSQRKGSKGKSRKWLCAGRPALQQCKQRATEERWKKARSRKAKSRKACRKETDEDDATTRPAGDEASVGDDASATSNISDIGFGNEIAFFGGIDAQIGNSAAPATVLAECPTSVLLCC